MNPQLDLDTPLCLDAPLGTLIKGDLCYTPARESVEPPKTDFLWAGDGPHLDYLDIGSQCRWNRQNGDWIDLHGAEYGSAPAWQVSAVLASDGSAYTYRVTMTAAVQQAQALGMHTAWIVRCLKKLEWCGRHSDSPPLLHVVYDDGEPDALACVASVGFKRGSAYSFVGRPMITTRGDNGVLEFARPKKPVAEAWMDWAAVGEGLVEGFLIKPPMNPPAVTDPGLAGAYPMDAGLADDPDVFFAQNHLDGTTNDAVIARYGKGNNYAYKSTWSPHMYSDAPPDTGKLPYTLAGESIRNKFFHGAVGKVPPTMVPSTYQGEGFYPLAPGLGALKIVIPGAHAPDGANVGNGGSLGCDLWTCLPEPECGRLEELYCRYYIFIAEYPQEAVRDQKMYRSSPGGSAIYIPPRGKMGFAGHHRTEMGGQNRQGGGNRGYALWDIFVDLADMAPGYVKYGGHFLDFLKSNWPGTRGDCVFTGQMGARYMRLKRGRWIRFDTRGMLNDWTLDWLNPTNNAEFDMWIDGVQVIRFRNFPMRQGPINTTDPEISKTPEARAANYVYYDPASKYLPAVRTMGVMGTRTTPYQGGVTACEHDQVFFLANPVMARSYIGAINMPTTPAPEPLPVPTPDNPPVIDYGKMLWSPTRDENDIIPAGNWKGLPANRYVLVNSPPLLDAVEKPYYTARSGAPSWTGIMNTWSGAAWSKPAQEMFITGGGHFGTSSCETAIYRLKAATLLFDRAKDRDPQSENGDWTVVDGKPVFTPGESWWSSMLKSGQPGAVHTSWSLLWIPPEVMHVITGKTTNKSGGIFYASGANTIYDLDTKKHVGPTNWKPIGQSNVDLSASAAFLDGTNIYGPHNSFNVWKWALEGTQETLWSPASLGVFTSVFTHWGHIVAVHSCWGWIEERRECFGFYGAMVNNGTQPMLHFTRARYGQAIDAGDKAWSKYCDTITLTSDDGSHLDFSVENLTMSGPLFGAGNVYDADTATLYIQGSTVGAPLYKVTGLDGNTWTTQKIHGAEALTESRNGVYGRMRLARLGGEKVILRVSSVTDPVQVMRLVDGSAPIPDPQPEPLPDPIPVPDPQPDPVPDPVPVVLSESDVRRVALDVLGLLSGQLQSMGL